MRSALSQLAWGPGHTPHSLLGLWLPLLRTPKGHLLRPLRSSKPLGRAWHLQTNSTLVCAIGEGIYKGREVTFNSEVSSDVAVHKRNFRQGMRVLEGICGQGPRSIASTGRRQLVYRVCTSVTRILGPNRKKTSRTPLPEAELKNTPQNSSPAIPSIHTPQRVTDKTRKWGFEYFKPVLLQHCNGALRGLYEGCST